MASVVAVLALAQLTALGAQFAGGYRPFARAPGRVPLSWDMFATAITRCDVRWDPPLVLDGRSLVRLRDTGARFEWDPVFDREEDYVLEAEVACARARQAVDATDHVASLTCFSGDGRVVEDALPCR